MVGVHLISMCLCFVFLFWSCFCNQTWLCAMSMGFSSNFDYWLGLCHFISSQNNCNLSLHGTCWPILQVMVNARLVETHIFSFVVGRAFVTDIEKLKIGSKTRSLDVAKVLKFFSEVKVCVFNVAVWMFSFCVRSFLFYFFFSKVLLLQVISLHYSVQDGISPGSNLLSAVEVLVSGVNFLMLARLDVLLWLSWMCFSFSCLYILVQDSLCYCVCML